MSRVLASFPQSKFDEVQIRLSTVRGKELVDVRVYTSLSENEEKIPTGKGIALTADQFDDLKKAIEKTGQILNQKI